MKVLKVNGNCNGCGLCVVNCKYMQENADGNAEFIQGNFVDEKDYDMVRKVISDCLCNAIELVDAKSAGADLGSLVQKLNSLKEMPLPSAEEFKFVEEDYSLSVPGGQGEYKYKYSGDSAAENAALKEFERCTFSQKEVYILQVVTQYRVKVMKKYYSSTVEEGSVYAIHNRQVNDVLRAIKNILGSAVPSDFDDVDVLPNDRVTLKMLQRGEMMSNEFSTAVLREFDYSPSQYDCYWRTDDMEMEVGTDWRGNPKYKYMYCYYDIYKANEEFAKDILRSCYYARDHFEEKALSVSQYLIKLYNDELKKVIQQKMDIIRRNQ